MREFSRFRLFRSIAVFTTIKHTRECFAFGCQLIAPSTQKRRLREVVKINKLNNFTEKTSNVRTPMTATLRHITRCLHTSWGIPKAPNRQLVEPVNSPPRSIFQPLTASENSLQRTRHTVDTRDSLHESLNLLETTGESLSN